MSQRCPPRCRSGLPLVPLLLAACTLFQCHAPTDEERWLKLIQHSSVYTYTALKIVVAEPERDDQVRAARTALGELSVRPGSDSVLASGEQALLLARALWQLRALGEAEVAKGRASTLRVLLTDSAAPLQVSPTQLAATEHGALLLLLLLAQLDSRSPLPLPPQVLLYEAYMVGPAQVWQEPTAERGLAGLVLSAQASVTAAAELCDVAGGFTDALVNHPPNVGPDAAQKLLGGLALAGLLAGNPHTASSAENALLLALVQALPWAMPLLAHVRTAQCFDAREQRIRAGLEWQRAAELAVRAGLPKAEVALLQAFAAYRAQDWGALREHLRTASDCAFLSAAERQQMLQLSEKFEPSQSGTLDGLLNKALMTRFVLSVVSGRVQQAGVYDRLLAVPQLQRARLALGALGSPAFSEAVGAQVSEALGEGAAQAGPSLWQRLKSLVPGQ